jgi:hypothetical protein
MSRFAKIAFLTRLDTSFAWPATKAAELLFAASEACLCGSTFLLMVLFVLCSVDGDIRTISNVARVPLAEIAFFARLNASHAWPATETAKLLFAASEACLCRSALLLMVLLVLLCSASRDVRRVRDVVCVPLK